MMTLIASALAGGDCIDDADALRAGGTAGVLDCTVKAPSTLGTFLRSFRWGHVRQLDRVSRELLARAWAAGAGPGDAPFTIDLDSTICETYGLAKEGARHHGYTGQRGYHPLLAVGRWHRRRADGPSARGPGQHRSGRRPLSTGDGGRVRHAGATGQLTMGPTAVSTLMGWYPSAARQRSVSPSPSASVPACAISSRPSRRMPGRPSPIGWRAPPMWPRPLTLPSEASPMPRRCGSSSGG